MREYNNLSKWIDEVIENITDEVIAVNFNLYEGDDESYHIQIVGTDEFDDEDEDWVCEEVFSTEENIFMIDRTTEIEEWKDGQVYITKMVRRYLEEGKYKDKLRELEGVGIGFVDGDIEIL